VYSAMQAPFATFRRRYTGAKVRRNEDPPRVAQGANAAQPRELPLASRRERLFCTRSR
jgi:hypothetical protein